MPNEIICVGDSITGWNYTDNKNKWPFPVYPIFLEQILQKKKIQNKVINAGFEGDRSERLHDILFESNAKYKTAKYFVILIGTNDICQNPNYIQNTTDTILVNIGNSVYDLRKENKIPILVNIPKMFFFPMSEQCNLAVELYNDRLESYCRRQKIKMADISSKLTGEHFADGVHPNEEGAKLIANNVYKTLKSLL
jgi:lysophospholipase L1-like esterase